MNDDDSLPLDDGLVVESTETESPEALDEGADLAPATEAEQETQQEPELSEYAQKAINKKHWQAKDAERKATAAEQKAAELERQLAELESKQSQTASTAVEIPPFPDPFELSDEEFRQRMLERDQLMAQNARYEAQQAIQAESQNREKEAAQRKQQAEAEKIRNDFAGRATALGLDADSVLQQTAGIVRYGVSDIVAEIIATDSDGPLMAAYLYQNPDQLDKLSSMSQAQQAIHMANAVKASASLIKPKTSKAPPPPTDISAGGRMNETDPLLEGLTLNI